MAKPKSEGFPYCQQDTDTFFDAKIRTLLSRHGCDGYALWDYIKQAAYREHGFYMEWNDDRQELAAADLYMSYEKIGLILGYLLRRSLLVELTDTSRNGVKVLTSHGIQKRFQRMAKDTKRRPVIEKSLWMLSEEETLDCISFAQKSDNSGIKCHNSGINADNSGIMTQSKVKKSKEEKRKERDISDDISIQAGGAEPPNPPKTTMKHKYGEYHHVFLSEEEYEKLTEKLGADMLDACIEYLDGYIEEKGYKSKSHYLSITRWVVSAVEEREKRKTNAQGTGTGAYQNNACGQKPELAGADGTNNVFLQIYEERYGGTS